MPAYRRPHGADRPRPWLAALLSLLRPGLGHVYVGRLGTGVAIWLGLLVAGIALLWIVSHRPGRVTTALLPIFTLGAPIAAAVHAWKVARQPLRGPPRRPLAVLATVIGALVVASRVAVPLKSWARRNIADAKRVPSAAMGQTLALGDWIFLVPQGGRPLERGQLVAFRHEGDILVKRLLALDGDTIAMREGVLVRNGLPQDEPYAVMAGPPADDSASFAWQSLNLADRRLRDRYRPSADSWGPLIVPRGFGFVLGDNRHESLDSRYFGWVSRDSIVGRPSVVYFSWSRDSSRVRWNRVGRAIPLRSH